MKGILEVEHDIGIQTISHAIPVENINYIRRHVDNAYVSVIELKNKETLHIAEKYEILIKRFEKILCTA